MAKPIYSAVVPPENTPTERRVRRWLNRWSILALMVVAMVLVVLFISNSLAVKQRVIELNKMKAELQELRRGNELLKTKIIQLQSPGRITEIAKDKLGMTQSASAPLPVE